MRQLIAIYAGDPTAWSELDAQVAVVARQRGLTYITHPWSSDDTLNIVTKMAGSAFALFVAVTGALVMLALQGCWGSLILLFLSSVGVLYYWRPRLMVSVRGCTRIRIDEPIPESLRRDEYFIIAYYDTLPPDAVLDIADESFRVTSYTLGEFTRK